MRVQNIRLPTHLAILIASKQILERDTTATGAVSRYSERHVMQEYRLCSVTRLVSAISCFMKYSEVIHRVY